MGYRRLGLYYHFIWKTQQSESWITERIERALFRCIVEQFQSLGCEVLAINGVPDHIHLVAKLRSTVPVATVIKQGKGVSSKFINDQFDLDFIFRWEKGYRAFSISRWDLPMIINYVQKQKSHHLSGMLDHDLE